MEADRGRGHSLFERGSALGQASGEFVLNNLLLAFFVRNYKRPGEELVRNVYRKLFDKSSLLLENMLKNSTGMEVRNINVEIDPEHL